MQESKPATNGLRFNPAVVGEGPQYTTKNAGKSDLVLYLVVLK